MKIVFTEEFKYHVPSVQQYNFCCVDWVIEDYQGKQAELVNVNKTV